jgi:hypothetical protein
MHHTVQVLGQRLDGGAQRVLHGIDIAAPAEPTGGEQASHDPHEHSSAADDSHRSIIPHRHLALDQFSRCTSEV